MQPLPLVTQLFKNS